MADNRSSVTVIDLGSQLLTDQVAFRKVGKYSLIEWTIRRLAESSLLDAIAVTGTRAQGSKLENLGIQPAIWFPSEAATPLGRTIEVAMATNAKWVVLVQANSPFVDPILIDRLIAAAWATPTSDVISFASSARPSTSPHSISTQSISTQSISTQSISTQSISTQSAGTQSTGTQSTGPQNVGLIAEIYNRRALRRLATVASVESDDRPVGRLLLSMPELFQPRYLQLPKSLDRDGVRWVLETEEDWERAHTLLDSSWADQNYRELADLAMHCDRNRMRS